MFQIIFKLRHSNLLFVATILLFQFAVNQEALEFQILRDTQGLHVPFKLQMERKIASRVRLMIWIQSTNLLMFTLPFVDAETTSFEKFKSSFGCTHWKRHQATN